MATKKRRTVSKAKSKRIIRKKAINKRISAKAAKKIARPRGKRRIAARSPKQPPETAVIYEVIEAEVYEPEQEEEESLGA